jgi:hypothetical protein
LSVHTYILPYKSEKKGTGQAFLHAFPVLFLFFFI